MTMTNDDNKQIHTTKRQAEHIALLLLIYFSIKSFGYFLLPKLMFEKSEVEEAQRMSHAARKTNKSHWKWNIFVFHFAFYFTVFWHATTSLHFLFCLCFQLISVWRIDWDAISMSIPLHLDNFQNTRHLFCPKKCKAKYFWSEKWNSSINEFKIKREIKTNNGKTRAIQCSQWHF